MPTHADLTNDPRITEFAQRIPLKLYRYINIAGHRMDWARRLVVDSELFFPRPSSFNDPLDCRIPPTFQAPAQDIESYWRRWVEERFGSEGREHQARIDDMVRKSNSAEGQAHLTKLYFDLLETYGVACFVKGPTNMLMWSYYTAGHSGLAIRFDTNRLLSGIDSACMPLEVNYATDFPEDVSFYSDDRYGFVQSTLGTKADAWKHEEECRLVLVGKSGYIRLATGTIDGVIFGLRTPDDVENSVRQWVNDASNRIEIMRVTHRPKSFLLEIVPA